MNYACTKMIDASVLLYFSFDSSFSQSRSMGQAVPTVHLTFYRLAAVIRDMSDIYRYSDHSLCHLNHGIHNSTSGGSFRTGAEQPVLPANSEWSDCILAK